MGSGCGIVGGEVGKEMKVEVVEVGGRSVYVHGVSGVEEKVWLK